MTALMIMITIEMIMILSWVFMIGRDAVQCEIFKRVHQLQHRKNSIY